MSAYKVKEAWVYPPTKYESRWRLRLKGKTYSFNSEQELNQYLQGVSV